MAGGYQGSKETEMIMVGEVGGREGYRGREVVLMAKRGGARAQPASLPCVTDSACGQADRPLDAEAQQSKSTAPPPRDDIPRHATQAERRRDAVRKSKEPEPNNFGPRASLTSTAPSRTKTLETAATGQGL
ncbi:hypothetical protein BKA81DRAFT_377489 [Phyllosticta paracitricarpa]